MSKDIKEIEIIEVTSLNDDFMTINSQEGCDVSPCWFVNNFELSRSFKVNAKFANKSIFITGDVKPFVSWSFPLIQENELASHVSVFINDRASISNCFSEISSVKKDGSFAFSFKIVLNPGDVSAGYYDKPRRVKINYSVKVQYCKLFSSCQETEIVGGSFDFVIHKQLGDVWMGLDPGTSGSCVCIGGPSTINNPQIIQLGDEIIESRLIIPQNISYRQDIKDYEPGVDYRYGRDAMQFWAASIKNGDRGFMSIKKLLGYNKQDNQLQVQTKDGEKGFSGLDIAHLLIKGIQKDAVESLKQLPEAQRQEMFGRVDAVPDRVVVAIPNNYTMPKILDMVESVNLLGVYKEIRYIYEPEAVLFNYFMKEYYSIVEKGTENVLVFDMGGATINLSLYKISVQPATSAEDEKCVVKTVGKVGYSVGGDNIDFALIESLIHLFLKGNFNSNITNEQIEEFEKKHKDELLKDLLPFKIALIDAFNHNYSGPFINTGAFLQTINRMMEPLVKDFDKINNLDEDILKYALDIDCRANSWTQYLPVIIKYLTSSSEMEEYVLSRVRESICDIKELCEGISIDRLIFSGRSVKFPGIKETVKKELGVDCEWNGLIANEVKTAVAKGCCWYGMFSRLIKLDNELITSSYGYTITIDGITSFKPIIKCKSKFDSRGKCEERVKINSSFLHDGSTIRFYQMMGAGKEGPFDGTKLYKRIYLGKTRATTKVQDISMTIDRRDNIKYTVNFTDDTHIDSKVLESTNRDILDENDRAYAFATFAPIAQTITSEPQQKLSDSKNKYVEPVKVTNANDNVDNESPDEVINDQPIAPKNKKIGSKRTRI